jgi:hypothetical protein
MTIVRHARRAGALLIPFALIVAACGGTTSSTAPASGGTSEASPTASVEPAASQAAGESPGALPSFAIPSFDIGELTKGLANVDSYRVSISVGGVEQYKGVVVTKPVLSRDVTISGGTRIVVIGNEAWTAQGSEPLKSVPAQLASGMFAAFDPTLLVGMFSGPQWAASSLDKGTEQKNGVDAKHLVIDSSTAGTPLAGLPAGASIDLWIADKGYLVALETKGTTGGDISIEVTGVDDPANKVDRPS